MSNTDKIKIDRLIHKIGLEYNLPDEVVKNLVASQFEFTADKINNIDIDSLDDDENMEKLKSVFLYKTIGKLYLNKLGVKNYLKRQKNGRSSKP